MATITGKTYLQWHGPKPQLVITEPEMIREILSDRERVYPKPNLHAMVKKVFGDGLPMSRGEKWAKMRKIANGAFLAESLKVRSQSVVTFYFLFFLFSLRRRQKMWASQESFF